MPQAATVATRDLKFPNLEPVRQAARDDLKLSPRSNKTITVSPSIK